MALSNILVEPRREITETLVGAALIVPLVYADWWQAWHIDWSYDYTTKLGMILEHAFAMFLGALLVAVAMAGLIGASVAIHALGDKICDLLQEIGVHLRPRTRWQKRAIYDVNGKLTTAVVECK